MKRDSTVHSGSTKGNVLLLSQRRIASLVAYCLAYEFEDVWSAVTGAERIDAADLPGLERSRRAYKAARLLGSRSLARKLAPQPPSRVLLERDFDLFFPVFSHTYELYSLASIPNWRDRCRKAACFITEVWSDRLPTYLIELLADFDHIFIGFRHSVDEVARITGRPCTYLPLAVDALRFAPILPEQPRPVWIANIGRRSAVTHRALREEAERTRRFYYYDTVAASSSDPAQRTFHVDSASEHRALLATILTRSRYYIANRSRVNEPEFTVGREEISARFYEGAAAGTVMIGEAPRTEEFRRQFDWPDAVIHVPFDSPGIAQTLSELDADSERLEAVRRNNVRHAALRHDFLYRIRTVLDTLGLEYTDAMRVRARKLEQIAELAQSVTGVRGPLPGRTQPAALS